MDKFCILVLLVVTALRVGKGQDRRCDVPADVVFLMDASDSIKDTEWEQEKDFVSVLIDNLEVDRHAIHVGVIVYSTEIGLVIDLQPFKTKEQLKGLLQQAVQINQGTDTAKAISRMIEMSDGQGRTEAGAKQIAVIITDGRSTDVSATIREARRARQQHSIDMIALGVGNETFLEEMTEITGPENPNRLFQVKTFGQLRNVVVQLQDLICEIIPPSTTPEFTSPTTTTTAASTTSPNIAPFPCSTPAEVIFLIDGSYSISPPDWIKGKQFISFLINSMDVALESVHIGMVVYGSDIGDVVPLHPFRNKTDLISAATALIQPPVGRTNTALGLQKVRDMIKGQSRPRVSRIVIVITDGMSSNPSETSEQAELAKQEGIIVFVIGVTDRVLQQEVEDMATSLRHLFYAPDFTFLISLVGQLRDNICTAIQETTATTTSTPTPTIAAQTFIPALCRYCLVEGGVGFNPFPDDCEKYVMCVPLGATYDPHIKSCPFGMFWSNESVSCLDARYVDCPADKCRALPNSATYASSSSSCRAYFRCSNSRSSPHCCESGFAYVHGVGCSRDPSCLDPCPLNVTIYNKGACRYRPDPENYHRYLEVIPGQGHVKRTCTPGQVYSNSNCACTFDAKQVMPLIACTPSVNVTFDGNFENHAILPQPITVNNMTLTNKGTAYFNGDSFLSLPASAGKDMRDNLVIKFKYWKRNGSPSQEIWNNKQDWGFRKWFSKHNNYGNAPRVIISQANMVARNLGIPQGADRRPLETITITKNGTVIREPSYDVRSNTTWPNINQSTVDFIQLGSLGSLATPTMADGIVYLPVAKNKLLIQEPVEEVIGSDKPSWKLVSLNPDGRTGRIEVAGQGGVPLSIQEKYNFTLRPPAIEKWYILAPGGIILQEGEGPVPESTKNRYAGFSPGTLFKVAERGDMLERWQVSKPDGSQLQEGQGAMPQTIIDRYNLSKVLSPGVTTTNWYYLDSDGKALETGTGPIPPTVKGKYTKEPSVTVLKSTSRDGGQPLWEISRPSGVKVLEGRGALPQGISRFVRSALPLPQMSIINKWTVNMPDGTVRNGTGQIPQNILDLYRQTPPSNTNMSTINKWTVTMPDGTVRNGTGQIPPKILDLYRQMASSNTNIDSPQGKVNSRWTITLHNGTVMTGFGEMPTNIKDLVNNPNQGQQMPKWSVTLPSGILKTGDGVIPEDIKAALNNPNNGGLTRKWAVTLPDGTVRTGDGPMPQDIEAPVNNPNNGGLTRKWTVTLPDGTVRTGDGPVPQEIEALMNNPNNGALTLKWTVTLPNGTVRTGDGPMPQEIKALMNNPNNGGLTRKWTVTLPDGTVRTGEGTMPKDIEALVNNPNNGGLTRRWSVTLPDGTVRTGEGTMPKDIEAVMNNPNNGGVTRRWSVTLPDGTVKTGEGAMPQDIEAIMSNQAFNAWQITLSNGTVKSGFGDMPSDLKAMLQSQESAGSVSRTTKATGKQRRRRAITPTTQAMDLLANCGPDPAMTPSVHVYASDNDITINLVTSESPSGVTMSLPVADGVNDIMFIYDGAHVTGVANGYVRKLPLKGKIQTRISPLAVGQCMSRKNSRFVGELDSLELYHCLP